MFAVDLFFLLVIFFLFSVLPPQITSSQSPRRAGKLTISLTWASKGPWVRGTKRNSGVIKTLRRKQKKSKTSPETREIRGDVMSRYTEGSRKRHECTAAHSPQMAGKPGGETAAGTRPDGQDRQPVSWLHHACSAF